MKSQFSFPDADPDRRAGGRLRPRARAAGEAPAAVASLPKVVPRVERIPLKRKGYAALGGQGLRRLRRHFGASGEAFIAAGCQAMAGNQEAAFAYLARAIDGRFDDLEDFDGECQLQALRGDPRWAAERAPRGQDRRGGQAQQRRALVRLHDEDQADRKGPYKKIDWSVVGPATSSGARPGERDPSPAAPRPRSTTSTPPWSSSTAKRPTEAWRAYELALKAVELDPEHDFAPLAHRGLRRPLPGLPEEAAEMGHPIPRRRRQVGARRGQVGPHRRAARGVEHPAAAQTSARRRRTPSRRTSPRNRTCGRGSAPGNFSLPGKSGVIFLPTVR